MPVGRLFFEIEGNADKLNASLKEALAIAEAGGIKVTNAGRSIIASFEQALNPTKALAEQIKLLEKAGKDSTDIWTVLGDKMQSAAHAATTNGQAIDPLIQKHLQLNKATTDTGFSIDKLGATIQNFLQNPIQAAQSGLSSIFELLGPTALGFGAIGAGIVAAGVALYEFTAKAAEAAEHIKNLSYTTGMSVENVQALQRLGEERGIDNLTGMIEKLNIQLGKGEGGDFTQAIIRMNIAVKEGAGSIYYLEEMRKKYAEIPDATKRAEQAAADLGRRLFHEVGPLVLNTTESITEQMDKIKSSGAVMAEAQINYMTKLNEQMHEHGRAWQALTNTVKTSMTLYEAAVTSSTFWKTWLSSGGDMWKALETSAAKITGEAMGIGGAENKANMTATAGAAIGQNAGEEEIKRRAKIIAQADAEISGSLKEVIGLQARLNELEKEYANAKKEEKGLHFDETKIESLKSQIVAVKDQIKDIEYESDAYKKINETAKKYEDQIKANTIAIEKMNLELTIKSREGWELSTSKAEAMLKKYDKQQLENFKIYQEAEAAIEKDISKTTLDELKNKQQMLSLQVPYNDAQRQEMEIERAHLDYAIKAEEIRVKYAQMRIDIENKISKLSPDSPLRQQVESDMKQLEDAMNAELSNAANVESQKILAIHQQNYMKMVDTVRDGAGKIFDALSTKGKDAFKSITEWLESEFMGTLRNIFQNFMSSIFAPSGQSGGAGGGGFISQLFGGFFNKIRGGGGIAPATSAWSTEAQAPYMEQAGQVAAANMAGLANLGGSPGMNGAGGGGFSLGSIFGGQGNIWTNLFGQNAQGMNLSEFFGGGQGGFFGGGGQGRFFGTGTGGINNAGIGGPMGGMMAGGGIGMFMSGLQSHGAGGWAKSIGGGAMTGLAVGGPIGAAIGAIAGAIAKGIQAARGKSTGLAGSMEVSRDLGVDYTEDAFNQFMGSVGLNKDQGWGIRKDLYMSPKFLVEQALPAAEAAGKVGDLIEKLKHVTTSWGTFDFSKAFALGKATGDWSELNKEFQEAFKNSKELQKDLPDWEKVLAAPGTTVKTALDELQDSITSFRQSIKDSITPVETMYQTFLNTGKITEELRKKITDLGGDISKFEKLSDLVKVNQQFQSLVDHFHQTGEILPELRKMFQDFGGDLKVLDDAAALPGLKTNLNNINSLISDIQGLTADLDPVKQLMQGNFGLDVQQGLVNMGIDPEKLRNLSGLIGMEKNWSNIAKPFTSMTPQLKEALENYGGAEGKLAIERYQQGFNTITQTLLDTTKAAMDKAYQNEIKNSLGYLAKVQESTGDKITKMTAAVDDQLSIVNENLTKTMNDAKNDVVDVLNKILVAILTGEITDNSLAATSGQATTTAAEGSTETGTTPATEEAESGSGGLIDVSKKQIAATTTTTTTGQGGVVVHQNFSGAIIANARDYADFTYKGLIELKRLGVKIANPGY